MLPPCHCLWELWESMVWGAMVNDVLKFGKVIEF